MNVIGPDISFYQDRNDTPRGVDFGVMAQQAKFVIIRAGQNLWVDEDFATHWQRAKAAGLPRGSYWFYDSRADPKAQAELWIKTLGNDLGELPLWCDFEEKYNGPYTGWRNFYNFIARLQELAPNKEIGIYTGYYYWAEMVLSSGIGAASLAYFAQFPLWIAAYNSTTPQIPRPWSHWDFWQFTDNGNGILYGVESLNIDLNYFNGTEDEFNAKYRITETQKPEETMSKYEAIVINTNTRLRDNHNVFSNTITSFMANTAVVGDEIFTALADGPEVKQGDIWLHATHSNGVALAKPGWVAVIHKGVPYCRDLKTNTTDNGGDTDTPTTEYQDLDLQVNMYQGALTVKINGEEWVKKPS